jgi:hypothetical protein
LFSLPFKKTKKVKNTLSSTHLIYFSKPCLCSTASAPASTERAISILPSVSAAVLPPVAAPNPCWIRLIGDVGDDTECMRVKQSALSSSSSSSSSAASASASVPAANATVAVSVSPLFDAADFPLFVARARVCAELVTAMAADVNAAAACKDDNDDDSSSVVLELKRTALGMFLSAALI